MVAAMLLPCLLLALVGALGAFDVAYFHHFRCRLASQAESRAEVLVHGLRGVWYALQFALVPNLVLTGRMYLAVIAFFVVDAAIAITDVVLEKRSRAPQGGLPTGEYAMHIVLSLLVGAFLCSYFGWTWHQLAEPDGIAWAPAAIPGWLHAVLFVMALGSGAAALVELGALAIASLPKPGPLHVRTRIATDVETLWAITHDHHEHPRWDHRFSRIVMLDDRGEIATGRPQLRTGTRMRYERSFLGMTIRGFGRYKLCAPPKQSTFEFWSEDWRSLIRHGVGLWRYTVVSPGIVEFRTSYTYEVRWGALGQLIDRMVFRPLLQRETEASFRRLLRRHFPGQAARVVGRQGRKVAPYESGAAKHPASTSYTSTLNPIAR